MFTKLTLDKTQQYCGTTHLSFDVPGLTRGSFTLHVEETEIDSGILNLIINHYHSDIQFIYELTNLMDYKGIKCKVLNGVLTVSIPERQKIFRQIDID